MPEIPTQPQIPPEIQPLVAQIDEIIEANGKVPQPTKDALMFTVVKSMIIQMNKIELEMKDFNKIESRVASLEKRNIITWCFDHPTITVFFITLFMILLLQHYAGAILKYIGIELPFP